MVEGGHTSALCNKGALQQADRVEVAVICDLDEQFLLGARRSLKKPTDTTGIYLR